MLDNRSPHEQTVGGISIKYLLSEKDGVNAVIIIAPWLYDVPPGTVECWAQVAQNVKDENGFWKVHLYYQKRDRKAFSVIEEFICEL